MGSFKGAGKFLLLEGDTDIPFKWELIVSQTAEDNKFIPFGADATAVTTTVTDEDGTSVTSIVQRTQLADIIISCVCNYPTEGPGTYLIQFAVTMNNADATVRNLHDRLYAELNQ